CRGGNWDGVRNRRTGQTGRQLPHHACGGEVLLPRLCGVAKRASDPGTDLRRLTTLQEIGQALSGSADLRSSLERALERLERDHQVVRSAVMALADDAREIRIEASVGISPEGRQARYRLGEGITGRVVQSSKPIVVPAISREPLFLNRAVQRKRP